MNGLAELLADLRSNDDDDRAPRPLPEAQVEVLKDIYARYAAPCPFKPGDLVTPRGGFNKRGEGEPHIVLEVPAEPIRNLDAPADTSDISSNGYGARLDMRVACLAMAGAYVAHWVESWCFEPYAP